MERLSKNETTIKEEVDETIIQEEEVGKLMQSLPKETVMNGLVNIVKYQGFWFRDSSIKNVLTFQKHFKARDSDIIIASFPKTGNTWLKAILFAIVNRNTQDQNLLLQKHPHELVCHLEYDVYGKAFDFPQPHHLHQLASPRLFSTHLSYNSLPESVRTSGCRILYITRNPLDTFVSMYYFACGIIKQMYKEEELHKYQIPSIEEYLEEYCFQEKCVNGPFFDHVVEYWKKSLEQPNNKILFLMYEDIKDNTMVQVKEIAKFIGFPFSPQEESEGIVEQIIQLCTFKNMQGLEANKNGVINKFFEKKSYFRKGEVGDWINHFSPPMMDKMMKFMEEKIGGTGLTFRFNSHH